MKSELDFVNYLKKIKTFNKNIIRGIGDDCAIVKFNSRKKYVLPLIHPYLDHTLQKTTLLKK